MEIEETKTTFAVSVLKFVYWVGSVFFQISTFLVTKYPREEIGSWFSSSYSALTLTMTLEKI